VKKEFAILRIQAHHVGRHHISGEIRRKLQNGIAGLLAGAGVAKACHEFNIRILPVAAERQRKLTLRPREFGKGICPSNA
jgi:hypothetical protein